MWGIGDVPAAIREYVTQRLMHLIRYRRVVRSSSDAWDEASGHPSGPGEPVVSDQIRRMQHYGFRSSPPDGSELVTVAVSGSAAQHVTVASELAGAGPQEQPSGDAEMYVADGYELHIKANGAEIKIDKDGGLTADAASGQQALIRSNGATIKIDSSGAITIDAAPGQQVVIQGSAAAAQAAARYNDTVAANAAMLAWMAAVNAMAAALVPPVTLPTPPATFAFISNGSPNTKIG